MSDNRCIILLNSIPIYLPFEYLIFIILVHIHIAKVFQLITSRLHETPSKRHYDVKRTNSVRRFPLTDALLFLCVCIVACPL